MKSFSLVLLAVAKCPVGVGRGGESVSSFGSMLWVQPCDLRGLSQPSRTAPLQGCPQGTRSRLPLNPAENFEDLLCFLFLQMTPLLFGKV